MQGTFKKWVCIIKNLLRKLLLWPSSQEVEGLKKYVLFRVGSENASRMMHYVTVREGILFANLIANLVVPIFIPQAPSRWGAPAGQADVAGFGLFPPRAFCPWPMSLCPCVQLLLHAVLWFLQGLHQDISATFGSSDLGESAAGTCRLSEYESKVLFCPIHRCQHSGQLSLDIVSLTLLPLPFPFRAKPRRKVLVFPTAFKISTT